VPPEKSEDTEPELESYSSDPLSVILEEIKMSLAIAFSYNPKEFDQESSENRRSPERNLLAAVLGHAFLDLRENRPCSMRRQALHYLCQEGFFAAPHYQEYAFLAKNICFALGLDYDIIKSLALQMYNDPNSVKFEW
jgi:hypothetical protein